MKIFIYRWLGSVGALVGVVTGHIVSKNTHAGYPAELLLVAVLSGVLASIGARIGQRLEQRRSDRRTADIAPAALAALDL
jgi:4-hydroxybenzoate polyprenyltransferase